ncbi:hypothetical protein D3C84_1105950 [compost metagenome]
MFLLIHYFLVAINGEVVLVGSDIFCRNHKGLLGLVTEHGIDGASTDIALDHLPVALPMGDSIG